MPPNPFTDVWHFLTATTSDYLHQGNWRYLTLVLFWVLLLASVAVALRNWREDPAQHTGRHLGTWLVRVLIGCMWFQGMLWKLPLPVSDGLQYWTEQESTNAAFELHRTFLKNVVLPNMTIFGPIVFVAELVFAGSMILGLAVRLVGVLAIEWFAIEALFQRGQAAELVGTHSLAIATIVQHGVLGLQATVCGIELGRAARGSQKRLPQRSLIVLVQVCRRIADRLRQEVSEMREVLFGAALGCRDDHALGQ